MWFRNKRKKRGSAVDFDEVLVDAAIDEEIHDVFEPVTVSMFERPFSRYSFFTVLSISLFSLALLFGRVSWLTAFEGEAFRMRAENNRVEREIFSAPRGIIYDRKGRPIVENRWDEVTGKILRVPKDPYAFAHVVGYVSRPNEDDVARDVALASYPSLGREGIERLFDDTLRGVLGERIVEVDATGEVLGAGITREPIPGEGVILSLDGDFQQTAYEILERVRTEYNYRGGALGVMDVRTGEMLALVSAPSFSTEAFSRGLTTEEFRKLLNDPSTPFLDRVVAGAYPPGSTIKPYVGIAALTEGIISPTKEIMSGGSINIPDPYHPGEFTVFKDARPFGYVNIRRALAVSSNVYFYTVGGGYGDIRGLGITRLKSWLEKFGFGSPTGIVLSGEASGIVPSPEQKADAHPENSIWRIGDTYHTSIGQGDVTVTPLQLLRAIATIANGGTLHTPQLIRSIVEHDGDVIDVPDLEAKDLALRADVLTEIHEGMRGSASYGTAKAFEGNPIDMAAKTGTAQLGGKSRRNHAWFSGFAPVDDPKIAVVVFLEAGPETNQIGGVFVALQLMNWVTEHGGIDELLRTAPPKAELLDQSGAH